MSHFIFRVALDIGVRNLRRHRIDVAPNTSRAPNNRAAIARFPSPSDIENDVLRSTQRSRHPS